MDSLDNEGPLHNSSLPRLLGLLQLQEHQIYESEPIKKLSALKAALEDEESPLLRKIFAILFPFGPAWNSILGTFYISS